jgi:hypothetical protein
MVKMRSSEKALRAISQATVTKPWFTPALLAEVRMANPPRLSSTSAQ